MPAKKYSKKVEIVDAVEYTGGNHEEIIDFCPEAVWKEEEETLYLGAMRVNSGDWIAEDEGGIFSVKTNFLTYYKPGRGAVTLTAFLGVAGLGDVGYRFYTANESPSGLRVTTSIIDAGDGWYSVADPLVPAGAASVRWDSLANPTYLAREYFVSPSTTAVADEVLRRDWTQVSGEAGASVLNALRSIRNRWTLDLSGTLTVYKEDGTTVAWQRNIRTDPTAKPIVGAD